MTQDELWLAKWQEVIDFMETYHRNPSKHRIEEHLMLNWIKHNRKLMNAGEMKEERVKLFRELLNIGERYRRKNQYGKDGVEAKCKALSMYRGVMRPYPHPRSAEYIMGLAAMRGGQWGMEFAEAFEVVLREY